MSVSLADIRQASLRIKGVANPTPVMTSRTFDERFGCQAFFKCENFQRVGAFKFRGAYNALSQLSDDQKQRGVLTFSSGNHAQAIALAGKLLGIKTVIVMPHDAPVIKRQATEGYGAEVISYHRSEESREKLGQELAEERGLTVVPPFNHPHIVAGQGTAGLELIEEAGPLDVLIAPCGGGGLLSGVAIAAKSLLENCHVVGVEPEAGNDACISFETGVLTSIDVPATIADGARTNSIGDITFALIREHVDQMTTAKDETLVEACRFYWERMKLIVEPTGALSVAAIYEGKVDVKGKRVGIVISGGNADLSQMCGHFAQG